MGWFEEWSEKRPDIVTTENFSTLERFIAIGKLLRAKAHSV